MVETTQASIDVTNDTEFMFHEQRQDPRERLVLPLQMRDGSVALTRDISARGLYFEIEGEHDMVGLVDFEMHLTDARMRFTAVGEIVRLQYHNGRTGVAVRLLSPRLVPLE
jgi:hypothetical protein